MVGSELIVSDRLRAGHDDWAWRSRPPGTGGRPAAVQSSSPQASTWFSMSRCPSTTCGVQEARISIWALPESSAIAPKLSVATRVTVPEAEAYVAPCAASASVSQDQPTSARAGSVIISRSISARA